MIMSDEEKDKIIKENLSSDKYVFSGNDEYDENIMKKIEESNIRPSKFTHTEKKIFALLICIIIFLIITTYYYYNKSQNIEIKSEYANLNSEKNEIVDEMTGNKLSNSVNDEKEKNETKILKVEVPEINKDKTEVEEAENAESNIQNANNEFEEKLIEEIKIYSLGIDRFDGEFDSKDENTLLAIMAMNTISIRDNISKTEITAEEVNKIINELTGNQIKAKNLETNEAYVKYISQTNKYVLVQKGNPYIYEQCKILNFEIISGNDDQLEVSGTLEKTVQSDTFTYAYTAYLTKNKDESEYFSYHIDDLSCKLQKVDRNENIKIEKF